jgi:hypothetical protein
MCVDLFCVRLDKILFVGVIIEPKKAPSSKYRPYNYTKTYAFKSRQSVYIRSLKLSTNKPHFSN